jgi:DNA-binding transcriptional LysR family regulator
MQWSDRIGRRLKPRDLHVLLAVAEHGNMAKAAERLAISRPVVSKTIADLEKMLGVRLLDRTSHGVEPTLYGRALLKRSAAVFDELRQSVEEIKFLADPGAGELRVGCNEVMAAGLVSAVVDRLSQQYPGLVFQMELVDTAVPTRLVRERKCELIVGPSRLLEPDSDLEAEPLFCEQLLVVAGPRSKWASQRKIALAQLVDEPWIQAHHEVVPGAPTFEAFRSAGSELPRGRIFSNSLNLRYSLLATGRFLTMVPASVLQFSPGRGLLKVLPVKIPRWRLPYVIITLRNRTLSPMAELFIDCLRETAKPLAKGGLGHAGPNSTGRHRSSIAAVHELGSGRPNCS